MFLSEDEVRRSLKFAEAAFPRFGDWKYNNEKDDSYAGFALWGEYVPEPEEDMPRRFYVTFDNYKGRWKGHLTIGQHSYFWSSADFGDACLLDTGDSATLDAAVTELKRRIADLFTSILS